MGTYFSVLTYWVLMNLLGVWFIVLSCVATDKLPPFVTQMIQHNVWGPPKNIKDNSQT